MVPEDRECRTRRGGAYSANLENGRAISSVLGLDFAVLLALVPKSVLGVSREEVDLDLVAQNVVRLSIRASLKHNLRNGNGGELSVQIG